MPKQIIELLRITRTHYAVHIRHLKYGVNKTQNDTYWFATNQISVSGNVQATNHLFNMFVSRNNGVMKKKQNKTIGLRLVCSIALVLQIKPL